MTPQLGVCYYPEHWPEELWAADAKEMAELGLSLVRIGEFAWSRLEPRENDFQFEWLDQAIETLGAAGLRVILGTPTATPPKWVVDKFPDMLAFDKDGRPRKFGSRRHYCFSHEGYRSFAAKISERIAKRYASNPHIVLWQTDNEYGCHDTAISYSPNARDAFRLWLKRKYDDIETLNTAWGNVFWSMEYGTFEDIDLPNLTVTEPNPAHAMDFRRFTSEQVVLFNQAQIAAIRKYCDKPITHNYMGRITDFDHFELGRDLEIATWDSYPLGFLEDRSDRDEAFRAKFERMGDPDFQAFHHDLYRAVGRGRWGVLEQQPGPVNWAPYNPAPAPGMVRVWTMEAFAHGAEFVCYFRWRQPAFAQEQMHTALKRPDNSPYAIYNEVRQIADEIQGLDVSSPKAEIGLVFDYPSQWAWEILPQGQNFDYFKLVYEYYCSLRQLGISIDIVDLESSDISEYKGLIIPGLFSLSDDMEAKLQAYSGHVLLGPRTNSKTGDFQTNLSSVSQCLGKNMSIDMVESLRPGSTIALGDGGHFQIWNECLKVAGFDGETKSDGYPVLIENGDRTYLTGWPDPNRLQAILQAFANTSGCQSDPQLDFQRKVSTNERDIHINYTIQVAEFKEKSRQKI